MSRKAKGPDGAEREWTPAELYGLFVHGFRNGAATTAMQHPDLPAYTRGYLEGQRARREAAARFAAEVGHVPTVLRVPTSDGE